MKKIFFIAVIVCMLAFASFFYCFNYNSIDVFMCEENKHENHVIDAMEAIKSLYSDTIDFDNKKIVPIYYEIKNNSAFPLKNVKQKIDYRTLEKYGIVCFNQESIVDGILDIPAKSDYKYYNLYVIPNSLSERDMKGILKNSISFIEYDILWLHTEESPYNLEEGSLSTVEE